MTRTGLLAYCNTNLTKKNEIAKKDDTNADSRTNCTSYCEHSGQ